MVALTKFDVQNNEIQYGLPTQMAALTNLHELWLNNNEFSGALTVYPAWTNLNTFSIYDNWFASALPTEVTYHLPLTAS